MTEKTRPKVFISYSWDSEEHKKWVLQLANDLEQAGIDVVIDKKDFHPSDDKGEFMDNAVGGSDRVVVICSEGYYEKAQAKDKGVSYEAMLIRDEVMDNVDTNKFIPVLRNNPKALRIKALKPKGYIDFRNDEEYEEKLSDLIEEIQRMHKRPTLDPKQQD